ncbi:hypothetical protein ABZ851_26105 [Streptomyces sp. NPDC047049]|uniref:hypothetical protein n=1 Tax=Streptomyces sp. NPDC047049 TaxID=3156688 RepID=UPI0033D4FB3F
MWHFPLAFSGYVEFTNVEIGLAVWALSFQLQEIILMWLYQRSGSVWVASLAHAGSNMVLFLILSETLDGRRDLPDQWVARKRAMVAPSDDVIPAGRRPGIHHAQHTSVLMLFMLRTFPEGTSAVFGPILGCD